MIIKKIAKLAKATNTLGVTDTAFCESSHQWIGGKWGAYDISDLPEMTIDQACLVFDFDAKTIGKMCEDSEGLRALVENAEKAYHFLQYEQGSLETHTTYIGDTCVKLITDKYLSAFLFVTEAQLAPLSKTAYTNFSLLKSKEGYCFLLIKEGLNVVAIIPELSISQNGLESWQISNEKVYTCMNMYQARIEARSQKADVADEEQCTLDEESEPTESEE